ncbi:MAG: hypothetical protein ACFFBC_00515 [Promethearchaeota archaeon]
MVVKNLGVNLDSFRLTCDECNSEEFAETIEGYVCRDCGMVLTVAKLQFDVPFKQETNQHSKRLGFTQIGTKRERKTSPHSWLLYRLNTQNLIVESEREAGIKAEKKISKILESLKFNNSFTEGICKKFKEIWPKLKVGSIYRNPEKLVTVIMYYYLRLQNIVIYKDELVEVSEISREEFRNFQTQVSQYFPEYKLRERRELISQQLLRIREHFNLDMDFYMLSKNILNKLWRYINNTKDDVIAGLCASIAVLCADNEPVRVHNICEFLNIRMSTIQLQVKKKIFNKFKINGFTTLVKSSGLLKTFLEKIGISMSQGMIFLNLNNNFRIFNPLNEHYFFELVTEDPKSVIFGYIKIGKIKDNIEEYGIMMNVKINLTLGKLYPSKDPPNRINRMEVP